MCSDVIFILPHGHHTHACIFPMHFPPPSDIPPQQPVLPPHHHTHTLCICYTHTLAFLEGCITCRVVTPVYCYRGGVGPTPFPGWRGFICPTTPFPQGLDGAIAAKSVNTCNPSLSRMRALPVCSYYSLLYFLFFCIVPCVDLYLQCVMVFVPSHLLPTLLLCLQS